MLETARQRLRETVAEGDSPEAVDARVAEVASASTEEEQAALWLYAWHRAGDDEGVRRPRRVVRADHVIGE